MERPGLRRDSDLSIHRFVADDRSSSGRGLGLFRTFDVCFRRSFLKALYRDFESIDSLRNRLLDSVGSNDRAMIERIVFSSLDVVDRRESSIDGGAKLALRTQAGHVVEAVILRNTSGRTTLCVSSQFGCAAKCTFCATGAMGVAKNLSADEIVDQALIAGRMLKSESKSIRNVVFMGMGEPFHNESAVFEAVDRFTDPRRFGLSPKRVVVSTVGEPQAMIRFAERFPLGAAAVSLHSADQATRAAIMPTAERRSLADIRTALERFHDSGRRTFIEYVMLAGVNDSDEQADALIAYLVGLNVHVNLIPYNTFDESNGIRGSDANRIRSFSERLKGAGLPTTTRYSMGRDVAAACGQLAREAGGGLDQPRTVDVGPLRR